MQISPTGITIAIKVEELIALILPVTTEIKVAKLEMEDLSSFQMTFDHTASTQCDNSGHR